MKLYHLYLGLILASVHPMSQAISCHTTFETFQWKQPGLSSRDIMLELSKPRALDKLEELTTHPLNVILPEKSLHEKEALQREAFYIRAVAMLNGIKVKQDIPKGLELLKESASKEFPDAQNLLAQIYLEGKYEVPRNTKRGDYWLNRSAKTPGVLNNRAVRMLQENGSVKEITEMLREAAARGVKEASFNLGLIYATGRGDLKPNPKTSKYWMNKARSQ